MLWRRPKWPQRLRLPNLARERYFFVQLVSYPELFPAHILRDTVRSVQRPRVRNFTALPMRFERRTAWLLDQWWGFRDEMMMIKLQLVAPSNGREHD